MEQPSEFFSHFTEGQTETNNSKETNSRKWIFYFPFGKYDAYEEDQSRTNTWSNFWYNSTFSGDLVFKTNPMPPVFTK